VAGRAISEAHSRSGSCYHGTYGADRWRHYLRSVICRRAIDEVEGDILFAYAKDEETAAEMEENFALHISIIATDILKREIGIVLVLPQQLVQ
jgi:hypothetical protein